MTDMSGLCYSLCRCELAFRAWPESLPLAGCPPLEGVAARTPPPPGTGGSFRFRPSWNFTLTPASTPDGTSNPASLAHRHTGHRALPARIRRRVATTSAPRGIWLVLHRDQHRHSCTGYEFVQRRDAAADLVLAGYGCALARRRRLAAQRDQRRRAPSGARHPDGGRPRKGCARRASTDLAAR